MLIGTIQQLEILTGRAWRIPEYSICGSWKLQTSVAEKNDTDWNWRLWSVRTLASLMTFWFLEPFDHHLPTFFFAQRSRLHPSMSQLYLMDQQNILLSCPAGRHTILPIAGYTYVFYASWGSFHPDWRSQVSLKSDQLFLKRLFMVPTSLSISRLP